MLGLALAVLFITGQEPQTDPVGPRHWASGQLAWSKMPVPEFPAREEGAVQAEVSCTVAERGRVRDCRIDRVTPEGTRFGRGVIRSLGRARLAEGRARAGDTMTFVIWGCSPLPEGARCTKIDWPVTTNSDR